MVAVGDARVADEVVETWSTICPDTLESDMSETELIVKTEVASTVVCCRVGLARDGTVVFSVAKMEVFKSRSTRREDG